MTKELISFDDEQLSIIKSTIARNTNDNQFRLFIQVCRMTGLNPFAKQIYAVVRGNDMTIQTGIDGYRILAERSGKYSGQIGPEWCDESGEWKDYWISNKPPVAARVGVLRRDFDKPIWGMARYDSYVQSSSPLWKKMPEVMLAKCAEALALRRAFPAELSGIYTKEEMDQADSPLPTPEYHVTPEEHQESSAAIEGPVVESLENIPTPSELRRRCADMQMTTKTGTPVTLDHVKRHVLKKEVADDELTPDECSKLSQFIDRQNSKAA